MSQDFNKGKIYKITNNYNDEVYIGSTCDTLNRRLTNHKRSSKTEKKQTEKKGTEIDEDGDGVMDGIDEDGDGVIDMYFEHRQCEHVWGDADGDGDEECLKCGLIKA